VKSSTKALLLIASLNTCSAAAHAQAADPHTVQPERPSVATHAGTVARGWVEIELGSEFDRYDDRSHGVVLPIAGKIGLASHVQLSILGAGVSLPGALAATIGDFAVGVKWRLADNAPVLGRFALLPTVKFPTGSTTSGAGTGTTDTGLVLISSHDLGPLTLDLNAAYTHRSGNGLDVPRTSTFWTISFGGLAAGPVGWGVELYGYPRTSGPAGQDAIVATLFGPTLSVRTWLTLDAGIILPVTGPQPRAMYFGGVWNVGRAWPIAR